MSLSSLLTVARDGALAQQAGLDLTGQNVSNVNTPGYTRRIALFEARAFGQGQTGGANFAGIERSVDRFARSRTVDEAGKFASADARGAALYQAEGVFTVDGETPIAQKMTELFEAFNNLAAYPGQLEVRKQLLQAGTSLADTLKATNDGLAQVVVDTATRAQDVARETTTYLEQIAKLNEQIARAQAIGDPAPALRDERDVKLRKVGEALGARAIEDDNGKMTVFAMGVTLVDGDEASGVQVTTDTSGKMITQVVRPRGAVLNVDPNTLGGTLAGLRQVHDVDVPNAIDAMDRLAFDVATEINRVHRQGYGLDDATTGAPPGRDFFTLPSGTPAHKGAAGALKVNAALDARQVAASSGAAAPPPAGNGNALALGKIATSGLPRWSTTGGTGTPTVGSSAASRLGEAVTDLGNAKASADQESDIRKGTLAQAEKMQQSASGVSLEEEMADLTKYQRAFEASIRVLRAADELLDGLIRG